MDRSPETAPLQRSRSEQPGAPAAAHKQTCRVCQCVCVSNAVCVLSNGRRVFRQIRQSVFFMRLNTNTDIFTWVFVHFITSMKMFSPLSLRWKNVRREPRRNEAHSRLNLGNKQPKLVRLKKNSKSCKTKKNKKKTTLSEVSGDKCFMFL